LALILLFPLMLVLAAAIWTESGRPILFGQQRVGRGFRPFTLWKFRSMRKQAGPLVTAASDPRITSVGRIIRGAKLDELPQFWNVLRGDMSLVGPRPEVAPYVECFRAEFEPILRVRPGITDPASIAFRHEDVLLAASTSPETAYVERVLPAKLSLSLDYVRHVSFRGDLSIFIRTLLVVLRPACSHRPGPSDAVKG
jgi:lipopolysaccharide/colanic/teichoic acid biosynthesis glycosyltransferase